MRNLRRRDFLKVGVAGASLGLLQGSGAGGLGVPAPASAATTGIKRGGTFTFATTEAIQEFNPLCVIGDVASETAL